MGVSIGSDPILVVGADCASEPEEDEFLPVTTIWTTRVSRSHSVCRNGSVFFLFALYHADAELLKPTT